MYADYAYYETDYLLGREAAIPEEKFPYWEKQARVEVDKHTFGRIAEDPGLITEPVKDCVCEIAELLYKADEITEQARQQGYAGPLASYSNDGESGSVDLSQSNYTESGKAEKIREIISRYLAFTGLLYAGVM